MKCDAVKQDVFFFAPIAILIAILILFAPALLKVDGLIYPANGQFSDLTITHWPAFEYLADSIRDTGTLPLWRTTILGGTPFAADPVVALWYPPNWFSLVLPLDWFFKLIVVAHLLLAGAAMAVLARSFDVGTFGATAAGVAYAIAPRVVAHAGAGHVTFVEAWAWLPLVVWGVRHSASAKWSGNLVSGAALGLCALADLRVAVYGAILLVSYVLIVDGAARALRETMLRLVMIIILTALIGMAAWLPAQSFASESTRGALSLDEASEFSLPPTSLLGMLLASRGNVERVTYLGLTTLVLAMVGARAMWFAKRRVVVWLTLLVALGVIVALGTNTPLYALLFRLPAVSLLRVPGRAWIMVTFAAALACGLGLDAAMRWTAQHSLKKTWRLTGWVVSVFALLFGLGGALVILPGSAAGVQRAVPSLIALAIFLPVTIGLLLARSGARVSRRRFGQIALTLLALDLIWLGWSHYRVVSRDEVFDDGREVAEYLVSASGDVVSASGDAVSASGDASYGVYSPSYSLPQHVAQAYGLARVDGVDPLQLERTVRFMQQASGLGPWGYSVTLPAFEGLERDEDLRSFLSHIVPDAALLGAFNVRYVVAHFPIAHPDLIEVQRVGDVFVYENAKVLARARMVGHVQVVADQTEALDWVLTHDLSQMAVVEGGESLSLDMDAVEVSIVAYEADRVELSAQGPGLLILSDAYERDWRALIDGVDATVYPANVVSRGVYVPEGAHHIEFVYDPLLLKFAVVVSGTTLIASIGSWFVLRRRST